MKKMNDKLKKVKITPNLNLTNIQKSINASNPFRFEKRESSRETLKHVFID